MTEQQAPTGLASPQNRNLKLMALIVPLISCGFSSVVGILVGQVGNLIYKLIGDTAACLSVPGFVGLFIITFGLSFVSNRLIKRLFTRKGM